MTPQEITAAAQALFEAEQSATQIGLLSQKYAGMQMEDAYAVQDALVARKIAAGRHQTGWKIGLTSRAMQQALNITTPDSGVLLNDMHFANGATIPKGRFIQPRIEAEIAFVMRAPLMGAVSRADVLAATDYVTPALEILDTRILRQDAETGAVRNVCDTIADNAANAGIILGDQKHKPEDLRWIGAIVKRDGVVEETGLGAGVLDDPVRGIVWIAERLGAYGRGLEAGQVVLSGSFIRPLECPNGAEIEADFGAFGRLTCAFE